MTLATLLAAAPASLAHNPAATVYEPAPFHGGLLVLGEEGTAARLALNGSERWQANVSGQLIQAPVVAGGTAATVRRTIPNGTPYVQAFDGDGPSWSVQLAEGEGGFGFVVPAEDGFVAVSTEGRWLNLSTDGEVRQRRQVDPGPATAPVPAPGGGWVLAGGQGRIGLLRPDGSLEHSTRLGGSPTDLARAGELVLASFERDDGTPTVKALGPELGTRWVQTFQGLRVGGELAVTEDRVYLGTYNPDGARTVALHRSNGTEIWDHLFVKSTAAAVTVGDRGPYVTVNEGVIALEPSGPVRWETRLSPRLVGPSIVGDLVLPSGAENKLVALNATDGSKAWTWTDGVSSVPWTDEQLARGEEAGADGASQDGGTNESPVGAAPALLAGLLAGAALARRSDQPR